MVSLEIVAVVFVLAIVMEIIDSTIGMMYGTLLSPMLIALGFEPLQVIPAILVSQAAGGVTGTIFHHKKKNADFSGFTQHSKLVLLFVGVGMFATALGVALTAYLPTFWLKAYIGLLVLAMGVLCLLKLRLTFSWWKMAFIAFVSSFNKSSTGGGFGPISSTAKIISGVESRVSVATTTLAEVPLTLLGFLLYVLANGLPRIGIIAPLVAGALIGGIIGPHWCARIEHEKLRKAAGIMAIVSGAWLIYKLLA